MSVMILDMIAEYTDRTTGNRQIRAQLIADTVTDLPSNSTALTYLLGSNARVIDTGKEYYIDSSGTWIEQPSGISLDLSGYYTSAETDALLSGKQDSLTQPQLDAIDNASAALPEIINDGAKNKLPITLSSLKAINTVGIWSGNVYTRRGISFTVNSDMTIDVSGTNDGTGDSWLDLYGTGTTSDFIGMICSGCPAGGSLTTYGLQCGNANWDYGSPDGRVCVQGAVAIVVRSGFDASGGLTFKPMICISDYWTISTDYAPPSLTNAELTAKTIKCVDVVCNLNNLIFTRSYGTGSNDGIWYTAAADAVSVTGLTNIYAVNIYGWESLLDTDFVQPYITASGTKVAFMSNTNTFRSATVLTIRAIGI